MRLAFVYIAEAYQLYHAASVMFVLMRQEGVTVDIFHIDPATAENLERLRLAHGMPPMASTPLPAGFLGSTIQAVKLLGLAKPQVLKTNEQRWVDYDAIISTEDGIGILFEEMPPARRPARIMMTHGAGTRYFPSMRDMKRCDFVIAKGEGDAAAYVKAGLLDRGQVAAGGYPKLYSTSLLADTDPLPFRNSNPTVLYNPHKERKQRSWDRFFPTLLHGFQEDRSRNLIVGPHVKFFRRRSERIREKLRALSDETILVDPASPRLLDNSYTEAADIYVGDVSSQVVEFIARPRPCVFLNAHGVDWQDDPHYALWHLGEVVDDAAQVMAAIDRAPRIHHRYAERQEEFAKSALGDTSEKAVINTADLIANFVSEWMRAR